MTRHASRATLTTRATLTVCLLRCPRGATSYTLEVEKVFKVGRHGEDEVFEKVGGKLHNRMLLWHGTSPLVRVVLRRASSEGHGRPSVARHLLACNILLGLQGRA